jgi:hypothetical protein
MAGDILPRNVSEKFTQSFKGEPGLPAATTAVSKQIPDAQFSSMLKDSARQDVRFPSLFTQEK